MHDVREQRDASPSAPGSAGRIGAAPDILATFVTTTSYGSWLPGDARRFVRDGVIMPSQPKLVAHARSVMKDPSVEFTPAQIIVLDHAICRAAEEFDYALTDLSIESTHVHWIVAHGFDPVKTMVGRLKTRMRQAVNRGRIWTDGYCHRCLRSEVEIDITRRYIARHRGCRISNGKRCV